MATMTETGTNTKLMPVNTAADYHDGWVYQLHRRLPAGTRLRCFEVDTPRTQPFKREMLKKAGVDTTHVT